MNRNTILAAFAAGILFGLGLTISGMANPAKVLGFLDIAGDWDPTLAFVMGGAIIAAFPAFQWAKRRDHPLLAEKWFIPTRTDIDGRLVAGAALFGIGWGIAGFCPGPGLAALGLVPEQALTFVVAMIVGMLAHRYTLGR
ncbi:YeeE/YedE family protein [Parvibaculum sp.]|uniref:YeeE/YedE family protein n=1 Tax=Parvibaculum sp. TaxID=2024848 RepID=UPI001B1A6E7A|nr:YeeE/YedE family protein [Parvibaculum sp.]MBO6635820.1 YeeE/YedE family protein [Parvibaculum sp.]MBO6679203.1 YeeE/YedE family protein [Parvibaculum sp.]MBO6685929.1 YeeE/YedE family protein [Parvibaculum sp.]MBO6905957.1 YeeE/YedE family protein [Parvibaculum sp.]